MKISKTQDLSSRKAKVQQRVAGQSTRRADGHEYIYLIVDRTPKMAKALGKLSLMHDTQKEAVQEAIMKLAESV